MKSSHLYLQHLLNSNISVAGSQFEIAFTELDLILNTESFSYNPSEHRDSWTSMAFHTAHRVFLSNWYHNTSSKALIIVFKAKLTLHPSKLPLVYWFLSSAMLQCQKMRNLSISQRLTFTNGIFSQSYPQSTTHRGTSPKQRLRSVRTTCPPNSLTPSSSPPFSSSYSTELTARSSFLQNHISSR